MRRTATAVRSVALVLILGASGLALASADAQQGTPFRAGVDLVAVDVQVVDDEGTPIESLAPGAFEVSISGKRRRVVSAEFIRSTEVDGTPFRPAPIGPAASNAQSGAGESAPGRVYILAFDVGSMTVGDSRAIVRSALTFIDRLLPDDRLGLYVFPVGGHLDPTTDHVTVRQQVGTVVGSRSNSRGFDSRYNLSPSEIVDINAESVRATSFVTEPRGRGASMMEDAMLFGDETDTIRTVQMRECGPTEVRCGDEIRGEALALATLLEAQATAGLNGIRNLVGLLSAYEGRKTVVMFSSGMPSSDRPGGRPDLGNLPMTLGKDAAATNTAIYTLHVDSAQVRSMGAATGRATGTAARRSRDHAIEGGVLEEFSAASGGALIRVPTGYGENALDRVLRETSSHYLLGVEPAESDRDGTLRDLRVEVKRDGATVRSRMWVTVPKRGS
jgi:VWFA-related protein